MADQKYKLWKQRGAYHGADDPRNTYNYSAEYQGVLHGITDPQGLGVDLAAIEERPAIGGKSSANWSVAQLNKRVADDTAWEVSKNVPQTYEQQYGSVATKAAGQAYNPANIQGYNTPAPVTPNVPPPPTAAGYNAPASSAVPGVITLPSGQKISPHDPNYAEYAKAYGAAPAAPPPALLATKTDLANAYGGSSIVDYLAMAGKPSDYASRAKLAADMGIAGYTGTAAQNTQLLTALRAKGPAETPAGGSQGGTPAGYGGEVGGTPAPGGATGDVTADTVASAYLGYNEPSAIDTAAKRKELVTAAGLDKTLASINALDTEINDLETGMRNIEADLRARMAGTDATESDIQRELTAQLKPLSKRYTDLMASRGVKANIYNSGMANVGLELTDLQNKRTEEINTAQRKLEMTAKGYGVKTEAAKAAKGILLSVAEAKELGVPYGTTKESAAKMGKVPNKGGGGTDSVSNIQSEINNYALRKSAGQEIPSWAEDYLVPEMKDGQETGNYKAIDVSKGSVSDIASKKQSYENEEQAEIQTQLSTPSVVAQLIVDDLKAGETEAEITASAKTLGISDSVFAKALAAAKRIMNINE